ncbi:hypothetical protein R4B61_00480 [Fructilactobacillus vespulae]|uniref:hypothetical protein n=1 Tax=Fructilactobacillus vespulae TaxID=1249630 RepID=UPI0039B6C305
MLAIFTHPDLFFSLFLGIVAGAIGQYVFINRKDFFTDDEDYDEDDFEEHDFFTFKD